MVLPTHNAIQFHSKEEHQAALYDACLLIVNTYNGSDIGWFSNFAGDENKRVFSGGEHAWDVLSESEQTITQGLYLFTVKDLDSGKVRQGKFAVLR